MERGGPDGRILTRSPTLYTLLFRHHCTVSHWTPILFPYGVADLCDRLELQLLCVVVSSENPVISYFLLYKLPSRCHFFSPSFLSFFLASFNQSKSKCTLSILPCWNRIENDHSSNRTHVTCFSAGGNRQTRYLRQQANSDRASASDRHAFLGDGNGSYETTDDWCITSAASWRGDGWMGEGSGWSI